MPPATLTVRTGFAVDIVGYSHRTAPAKVEAQRRVADLIDTVLGHLRCGVVTDRQVSGDGVMVFLPATVELHVALPCLLRATHEGLRRDNGNHRDRLRLRMAVVVGPVGPAALGFSGNTAIECSRLVDSQILRDSMNRYPDADVLALVTEQLYGYVVGEGHPGLTAAEFRPVTVRAKNFKARSWLWSAERHGRWWFRRQQWSSFGAAEHAPDTGE